MKAVIDIGSNTTQLLLAESKNGKAKIVNQQIRTTRLGAGIAQHLLTPQGIANTVAALDEYRQLITAATVGQIRLIATAAVRDAVNRQELLDIVQERFGWAIEVLSGSEEASLAYAGAVAATGEKKLPVVDIGGGSTEIIMVKDACATTVSAPLGAVRVMMAGWNEQKVMQLVRENFAGITFPAKAAIGVGGTITTAAGLLLGLAAYERSTIEGKVLLPAQIEKLVELLFNLSLEERCAYSPLLRQRGEIIVEGLWILKAIFTNFEVEKIIVTGGGIVDGVLAAMTEEV